MITLFHSHGIGPFDYSSLQSSNLDSIDLIAKEHKLLLCPTVYLRRDYLTEFINLMVTFDEQKRSGSLSNLLGFSIEGPLLGESGGIPRDGCWIPTVDEWQIIANLGLKGLRYLVMAPDILELNEKIGQDYTFRNLLKKIYDSGMRIALGHFRRDNPVRSVARIQEVLNYLHQQYESSPYLVLTDHLFNDMPRSFTHTWRTKETQQSREIELKKFLERTWESETLPEVLGPVPAILLQAAKDSLLTPAINFDGYHVDLEICRRTLSYLGAERLIAMTDDTELNIMAGEELYQIADNPLRYRNDGLVAAGSTGYQKQIENMISIGVNPIEVRLMFERNPLDALQYSPVARC